MPTPDFDTAAAHRYFAADCYNRAWPLLQQATRSEEEQRLLESLALASLYHWRSREDCMPLNLSIGHWLASRVYSVLGNAPEALRHGNICLQYSQQQPPFYLGFAYEALARATTVAGDHAASAQHLAQAQAQLALIADAEERQMLADDLATLAN